MKATIIKHIPGTSLFEVFIISTDKNPKALKLVSYAENEILSAIESGIVSEIPAEQVIENYSSHRMVDLLNDFIKAKYYQL